MHAPDNECSPPNGQVGQNRYKHASHAQTNGHMQANKIANLVWNLCHVLRDDGIVYHKYLSELTYLIFLKTAAETGAEVSLPRGWRWSNLSDHPTAGILGFYRKMLTTLGEDSASWDVREIFSFPTTVFSHDENLAKVVEGINAIDWHSANVDGLGNIYEALLERNATEARSGSGQYFTPRPLVDCIVRLIKPKTGESIFDPSAGTGGFLISANEFVRNNSEENGDIGTSFHGVEIEHDTYRLCLMNLFLHKMEGQILHGDALTSDADHLPSVDVVVANPPFGSSSGGARQRRADLPVQTSNKQLMFIQLIFLSLKVGGRAAVVVPDNVIADGGAAEKVRLALMERCHLHTVLRLPDGIFYAPGVKTNVLFFSRTNQTSLKHDTWVYDMRSDAARFGKSKELTDSDFAEFEAAFGDDPSGQSPRTEGARWKKFSRDEIAAQNGGAQLSWLSQDLKSQVAHDMNPLEIIAEMTESLREALSSIEQMAESLAVDLGRDDAN